MVGKRSVEFAESALLDLEALRAWYVAQGVPEVGARFVVEIVTCIEQLAEFPDSGRIVPEFALEPLREQIHLPFRIVYRVAAAKIWIVRVWRSERLLKMPG